MTPSEPGASTRTRYRLPTAPVAIRYRTLAPGVADRLDEVGTIVAALS